MDTDLHKPRPTSPWARRPGPGDRRRRSGAGAPPRALRETRSDAPREARPGVGRRPAMPGCPCTPEAGAANDLASAAADGHGHRFRLGVDRPDYLRLLRCFGAFARAVLHASVTRGATYYGFHRRMVSFRLASGSDNATSDVRRRRVHGQVGGPERPLGSPARGRSWCVLSRASCSNGGGPFEGQSTGRRDPTVQGVPRRSREGSGPPDTAASGWSKRPRRDSLAPRWARSDNRAGWPIGPPPSGRGQRPTSNSERGRPDWRMIDISVPVRSSR